eukprot:scaffold8982_cov125-Isochrysis_galbana.AAC.12
MPALRLAATLLPSRGREPAQTQAAARSVGGTRRVPVVWCHLRDRSGARRTAPIACFLPASASSRRPRNFEHDVIT